MIKGKIVISLMSVIKINSILPLVTLKPNMTYLNLVIKLRNMMIVKW